MGMKSLEKQRKKKQTKKQKKPGTPKLPTALPLPKKLSEKGYREERQEIAREKKAKTKQLRVKVPSDHSTPPSHVYTTLGEETNQIEPLRWAEWSLLMGESNHRHNLQV